jgi:hypothetical protein
LASVCFDIAPSLPIAVVGLARVGIRAGGSVDVAFARAYPEGEEAIIGDGRVYVIGE